MQTKPLLDVITQVMSGCRTNDLDKKNLLFADGHVFSWSPAISVSAKLPESCDDLKGIVNGNDLLLLLSRIGAASLWVKQTDTSWEFTQEDNDRTLEFTVNLKEDPSLVKRSEVAEEKGLTWKKLPGNFYECLKICDIPQNNTKLSGVFFGGEEMVSTDNRRVNRAVMDATIDGEILLSSLSVSEILKLKVQFTEYSVSDKWVHFRAVDNAGANLLTFSCNRLDETTYSHDMFSRFVVNAVNGLSAKAEFPPLQKTLALASVFDTTIEEANTVLANNVVLITFDKKKFTVSSERGASGKFKEKLSYKNNTELSVENPVTVKITASFLAEALNHTNRFGLAQVGKATVIVLTGDFFTTCISVRS